MTKIKIDIDGYLWLNRARKMKIANCPDRDDACGDWCACFKEEIVIEEKLIHLCNQYHACKSEEFEDERNYER